MPSNRGDAIAGAAASDYVYLGDIASVIAAAVPIAGARVRRTTNQVGLGNDAEVPVSFDDDSTAPNFDIGNFWVVGSPTVLTVPAGLGGLYVITGNIGYAPNATGVRFAYIEADIGAGFVKVAQPCLPATAGGSFTCVPTMAILSLAPTNQVRLVARQNSGGPLDLLTGTGIPFLSMALLSPHT